VKCRLIRSSLSFSGTFRSKPRLRSSCRGKSLVSDVTTARGAPTLSNSSFATWRVHSSAVQNGHQSPRKKLRTRVRCGAAARRSGDGRRRLVEGSLARCLRASTGAMPRLYRAASPRGGCMPPVRGAERRQQLGANPGECLVGLVWHRYGVRPRIDSPEAAGRRRACRGHSSALAISRSVACDLPRRGTSTDQSRSRATLTKASSAGE